MQIHIKGRSENRALRGYYASGGNSLPTFRHTWAPKRRARKSQDFGKEGPELRQGSPETSGKEGPRHRQGSPEMSVRSYHYSLR
jgi:hypothetical protein